MSEDGAQVYFALQDVPAGTPLSNKAYWILMIDVSGVRGGGAVFSVNGQTGNVMLTAADVGALPADTHIPTVPTNVSAFENDAGYLNAIPPEYITEKELDARGYLTEHQDLSDYAKKTDIPDTAAFITRAVNDLENYYLKSQTYSREEIDQKVSAIPKFSIQVVYALPTENISDTTIYLLSTGSGSDLYTEYIHVNGAWEILGSQRVDLTGYATQTWTLEQLSGYQPKGDYQPAGDYALRSELPTKLSDLSEDATHRVVTDAEKATWNGKLDAAKLPEAIDDALAQAKESGEFDGEPGYTPVKGKDYFDGEDGVSPTVAVSDITGGHRITITDASGTKTVDVLDGSKGDAGRGITSVARTSGTGAAGTTDTYTITYTDGATTNFYVTNGNNGKDGYSPVRGTDYWTDADKQGIVQEATENFPILAEEPEESVYVLESSDIDETLSIKGKVADASAVRKALDQLSEQIDAIPDYVKAEAETVARIVNQHQSGDSIIFPFLADAHCGYYTDPQNAAVKLAGQLLHQISKRVPYDFIANGGDMSNGAWNTTQANAYDEIEDYTELTRNAHVGVPAVWVPGNHDDAPYKATADRVSQTELFALIGRKSRVSGAVCPNGCNYGYLDLDNRKLRVIYLDTHDRRSWGSVEVGSGQESTYLNVENIGGIQLRWMAEHALNFTEKAKPTEWGIVVISHAALTANGTWTDPVSGTSYAVNTANAAAILSAYSAGKSGSITHNSVTVDYDFSALENRASVICCVHGHNHKFTSATVSGILSIGCPNVMNGRERVSDDGNTYVKTAGTADGTSFCILTIDRENQLIYADCVGAGYDREFEYTTEVVSYTNQLPISTDANGAVYNGKGYKENTYLSGGNEGSREDIYTTGFMPAVVGEYNNMNWYFRNVGMESGQDSHRLCLYKADKTNISTVKTTVSSGPFTWGADGKIERITYNKSSRPELAYIRLCCGYLGEDSIITAGEPIT